MTRNSRVFAHAPTQERNFKPLAKAKGKEITSNAQDHEGTSSPRAFASQKEVEEFLRIIKKSDYRVVNQLNHTPSKISMLSLLLSLEAHPVSLMNVLGDSHVTKDITIDQFDGVVANITAGSCLGLSIMSCHQKEGRTIELYTFQ